MDQKTLDAYADLIVKKGLNLDKGQEVLITTEPENAPFTRMVVEKCYQAGASKVIVDFRDMACGKLDQLYQTEETLSRIEEWELARLRHRTETLPAVLWLDSEDPDGMNGIDQGKRARSQMARFPKIKPYREAMENKHQWCIAALPGEKWACKVFPDLPPAEAEEKLWEAILRGARALEGDPIANWDNHNELLKERAAFLNAKKFTFLRYHSSNGTDFQVGLMPQGVFEGGSETDLSGRVFHPNIPSEEIFTTPQKGKAEGVLVSTKPLSWQGTIIDHFSIRFENGKAVEVHAEKGQDALEKMIAMDEGAPYLGECALIGKSSPINELNILFYSTLFDENASCHVALGRGFDNCVEHFEKYTHDELRAMGVNDSMIHVDFMIGSDDLSIDGILPDGTSEPIFRNGEWVIGK